MSFWSIKPKDKWVLADVAGVIVGGVAAVILFNIVTSLFFDGTTQAEGLGVVVAFFVGGFTGSYVAKRLLAKVLGIEWNERKPGPKNSARNEVWLCEGKAPQTGEIRRIEFLAAGRDDAEHRATTFALSHYSVSMVGPVPPGTSEQFYPKALD